MEFNSFEDEVLIEEELDEGYNVEEMDFDDDFSDMFNLDSDLDFSDGDASVDLDD